METILKKPTAEKEPWVRKCPGSGVMKSSQR